MGLCLFLLSPVAIAAPNPPSNLRASVTANNAFTLIWDDNATDETSFEVIFVVDGNVQTFPLNSSTPSATGTLSIDLNAANLGIAANKSYRFNIRTYNGSGYSAYPPEITINTYDLGVPMATRAATQSDASVLLQWVDNAVTETGYVIETRILPSGTFANYASVGPNTSSVLVSGLGPNTPYEFRIKAYKTVSGTTTFSGVSSALSATTTAMAPPTSLTAAATTDGKINLTWLDNTQSDIGYALYFKKTTDTNYTLYNYTAPSAQSASLVGLAPGTAYNFQVAAAYQATTSSQVVESARSNTANATTTSTLLPPTVLVISTLAPSETSVHLAYNDNTGVNTGYEIELALAGSGQFNYFGDAPDGVGVDAANSVAPGTVYDFRVRAYYQDASNNRTYSTYSNTATYTTPFISPTSLVATASATSPYLVSFSWTDNSSAETDYELQYRKQGGTFTQRKIISSNGGAAPNSMSLANLPEFDPGSIYEFQIRARYLVNGSVFSTSAFSNIAATTTKNGFSSKPFAPITLGVPFSYQLATISPSQQSRSAWSIGAGTLPAGLSFDSGTGIISGTPTAAGVFTVPMTANFTGGTSHVLNLMLRVIRPAAPPAIVANIGEQTLAPGGNSAIDVTTKFSDLDTESAVRMATSKGNIDIILYSTSTPGTVSNFLGYNTRGDYANTLFHRAPAGFVVQGGGYKSVSAPDVFDAVTKQAAITNEPGISNTVGTLAMAKTGDNPDSATSEFFFSLGDNSLNLDNQNGGFTVFGRVSAPSLNGALSALANVHTSSYNVKVRSGGVTPSSANFTFTDIPIDQSPVPSSINQASLMTMTTITALPILTYAITSNPNSAVATAMLNNGSLQIHGVGAGTTSLIVAATDVDGNSTPQTVNITVTQAPVITSAAPTLSGVVGNNYSFNYTASGVPTPTFTLTGGILPAGLTLASDGTLSGTPMVPGLFTGTITASNAAGTATQNFSITINQVPAFTSSAPTATSLINTAYSFTVTASGTPAPTFSVTAGALPTGLTLSSAGAITGTATASGLFTGTITATNAAGTATQNFSISINQAPALTNGPTPSSGLVGTAYSFTYTATGFPAPTFSVTGALPSGLSLSTAGAITGTPTAVGTFTGTVTASNGIGTAATQNFTITVSQAVTNWAASQGLSGANAQPDADPDHDGLTNLQEFAFMTNPNAGSSNTAPSFATTAGATKYGEITFPVRKFTTGLTYSVEASNTLVSNSWTTILWTSTDGFSAANVSAYTDMTDRTVVTIRDTVASPPATRRFLRVRVSIPSIP